jgi:hypothetical protein
MPNWPDHVTGDEMVAAMDRVGVDGARENHTIEDFRSDAADRSAAGCYKSGCRGSSSTISKRSAEESQTVAW